MIVWLVMRGFRYEGEEVKGVFARREDAEVRAAAMRSDPSYCPDIEYVAVREHEFIALPGRLRE